MPRRQVVVPGQATTLFARLRQVEAQRAHAGDHGIDVGCPDVAHHEVLVLRGADVVEAVCAQKRGEAAQVMRSEMTERHRHRHGDQSWLALRRRRARRAGPGASPAVGVRHATSGTGSAACAARQRTNSSSKRATKPSGAEALDEELDPRLGALGAVGVLLVQRDHRLHRRDQLVLRHERGDHDRLARLVAEPAAGQQPEAGRAVLARGDHGEVVQHALRAIALAAGKAHLEFARHLLVERIAQEIMHRVIEVRGDIGVLARAHAGERAGRHVAHRVVAGLARGQSCRGETPHRRRRVRGRHVVQLHRLARRHVHVIRAGPLLEHVRERDQLLRIEAAAGRLDPHHVHAGLALAVATLLQANRREAILGDRPREKRSDARRVAVELLGVGQRARRAGRQERLEIGLRSAHGGDRRPIVKKRR